MADWSTLPPELLHFISLRLPTSTEIIRFRSICTTWRSAAQPPPPATRFPILPNSGISDMTWGFYLTKRTIYSVQSPIPNQPSWIIKLDRDNPTGVHLHNPLTRSQFKPLPDDYPKLFNFMNFRVKELGEEYTLQYINFKLGANSIDEGNLYMEKVAVLNKPGGAFVLLTIHVSGKLVVFRSGEDKWRVIDELPSPDEAISPYDDVILREGKFYAADSRGRVVLVDHLELKVSVVAESIFGGDKKYLMDCNGEFLLVDKYFSAGVEDDLGFNEGLEFDEEFDCYMSERTVKFKVFKLDENSDKWVEVVDLGDRMLFFGDNSVFTASATETFSNVDFKGNLIFFTDAYNRDEDDEGGAWKSRGVGVFDLGSGSIGLIDGIVDYSKMFWPPPNWINSPAPIEVSSGVIQSGKSGFMNFYYGAALCGLAIFSLVLSLVVS